MSNVKYSFLDFFDQKILLREFSDDASIEDVIASFEEIMGMEMLANNVPGVITDLRNVKFEINTNVFKRVSSFLKNNPELYKYKFAAITISPLQVALVIIGNTVSTKLRTKPFSTLEAAVAWVCEP
ncbi:hypothetical protein DWB61_06555 [Ancylomarina euxinus]|uniref:STAS/SEC14 domain-containing protein n=1 Tax=Ancylomarina euxinus TaxID=2283627 RepID=A0A425Y4F5_9BACT|nr:hypothetical protein [Ancylomarina euxinus]MCZ4694695.1 hypothetical protein [Ancylomarina euxinus]MUP14239.1 hypothetical protein [Ancylomarina euxinus]RRG23087.1 hypothetical protein DWB61_06555 [Ancylomarina euxinus]